MNHLISKDASLLEALVTFYPDSSKRTLQQWIKFGRVTVDGKTMNRANEKVLNGQSLSLSQKETTRIVNGIKILYEDRYMIVIDKPANLLSVASEDPESVNALFLLRQAYKSQGIYAVHRLDQKTTGVLLFARGKEAEAYFDALFEKHELTRQYLGIVEGQMSQNEGTWENHLMEKENFDVHVTSNDRGKLAITHFKVLHRSKQWSYVRFQLETGRKHQIRVQCKEAGHPIAGDVRYGAILNPLGRLGLHAFLLGFIHPFTGKEMKFISPLPRAFAKLIPQDLDIPKEWEAAT
jgi:23S rRNA pseudouridine1911/1915/1917 synthase